MFLQLGTYKFEGTKLPQSWGAKYETLFGQIPIINNKPVVQKIGQALDEIEIGILLASDFCVPQDELDNLNSIRSKGIVSILTDGNGKNYGKFVLTSIEVDNVQNAPDGTPLQISATIKLLEYNTNKTVTDNTGIALSSNNPSAEDAITQKISSGKDLMNTIKSGQKTSSNIASAVKNGSFTSNKFAQISGWAASAKSSYESAQNKIENIKGFVNRAINLKIALDDAISAVESIKSAADIKNFSDLMAANTILDTSVYQLTGASSILAAFIGSREEDI